MGIDDLVKVEVNWMGDPLKTDRAKGHHNWALTHEVKNPTVFGNG